MFDHVLHDSQGRSRRGAHWVTQPGKMAPSYRVVKFYEAVLAVLAAKLDSRNRYQLMISLGMLPGAQFFYCRRHPHFQDYQDKSLASFLQQLP